MKQPSRISRSLAGVVALALTALVVPTLSASAAPIPGSFAALNFNGTNQGVGFGDAPAVGLQSFTIEAWFKRTGDGTRTTTGTAGIVDDAIPIVTKGRGQSEDSNLDMNWFLGIDDSADVIAADFEDMNNGTNHPVFGVTPIVNNTWYHASAAYNATTGIWQLFLNGQLEAQVTVPATPADTRVPRSDSIQDAGIGTAYNSTGTAAGFFAGVIDEVRVWNGARSQSQVRDTLNQEIPSSTPGLAAMWSLNDGSGTSVTDALGVTNSTSFANNPTWVDGYPFNPTSVPADDYALNFGGNNAYVDLGDPNALDLPEYTIEAWVKKAAGGSTVNTGAGGIDAYPIVAKGRAEVDNNAAADINYFLGIDGTGRLVADFEEGSGGTTPGLNHPLTGTTTMANGDWHHVAATYDGNALTLYVDGVQDGSASIGQPPNSAATAPVGIATAMNSLGRRGSTSGSFTGGYFSGAIDEVRIWDHARTVGEILAGRDTAITADVGLVSRFGFDEGSGTLAGDSGGDDHSGIVFNGSWVDGFSDSLPNPCAPNCALDFASASQEYVTFGDPASLDLGTFTIETWFRRDGAGTPGTTGTGGVASALPLVTHGSQHNEDAGNNINWFLGIDDATDTIFADFEEAAAGDNATGLNHPINGTTVLSPGVWYHAAATYDYDAGTDTGSWKLYLNGNLETMVGDTSPDQPTESTTGQHAALATSIQANGTTLTGFFDGAIDEARVWNRALTASEIAANMDQELTSGSGLVARWGLDEGAGSLVDDSVGSANGTAVNSPAWVDGATFGPANQAPSTPTIVAPTDDATGVTLPPTLEVGVSDPEGDPMDVEFWGRPATGGAPAEDFTVVAIPDTQHYSDSSAREWQYRAQTQWIVDNEGALNIKFASHLGDITEHGDSIHQEWIYADAAMDILDTNGIPNNLAPGNHDMNSAGVAEEFDDWFPPSRYEGEGWYGGYLGDPDDGIDDGGVDRLNKNNYETFSVDGLQFLIIHLEVDMPGYAVDWANEVIDAHPDHRVILSTHLFLDTEAERPTSPYFRPDGTSAEDVWDELVFPNCNVFLFLNGHYPGEARRTDPNACGAPVHQLVMDYQSRSNGGDGWLRYLTFEPSQGEIEAYTYSPTRNSGAGEFENDSSSRFTLDYEMAGGAFELIGTDPNVASGANASISWTGLDPATEYEWYAVADDGPHSTTGPTASFTTAGANQPPVLGAIGDRSVDEDTELAFTATATDPDVPADTLTFSLEDGTSGSVPAGAAIGASSGEFTWTPTEAQDGLHTFDVCVFDGTVDDCETIDVTVGSTNQPPVLGAIGNRSVDEGNELAFTATATDPDVPADTLTFSLEDGTSGSVPAGAAIGASSGEFTWTPTEAQDGLHTFDVCVFDGTVDDCETIDVTVVEVGDPFTPFTDDFESGTLDAPWVGQGMIVQSAEVADGAYAARATATGSRASAYRPLGSDQDEIFYRTRLKVVATSSQANLMRLYDGTTPIVGLNMTQAGALRLLDGSSIAATSTVNVADGLWHEVQLRALVDGANGQTEVWVDGVRIGSLSVTLDLGNDPIDRIYLGETNSGRTSDVAYDDVAVDTALIPTLPPVVVPVAFTDDFESGTLDAPWVGQGMIVQSAEVADGAYAARATATGSRASAYRPLGSDQDEIFYRTRLKVVATSSQANLMRLYDGTTPIVGLNMTQAGALRLLDGSSIAATSTVNVADGLWHEVQLRALVDGANGQTEVWVDGVRIGSLSVTLDLGNDPIDRIYLGETNSGRTSDVAYDDVAVDTALIPTLPPVVVPVAFTDDFESGTLDAPWVGQGMIVQSAEVADGAYAARATATGSRASAYRPLGSDQDEIFYRTRLKVVATSSQANLMRLYDGTTPIVGLNMTQAGALRLLDGSSIAATSTVNVADGLWHEVQLRALVDGANGQTEVWVDGVRIGSLSVTLDLGNDPIDRIYLGETNSGRTSDVAYDDVAVDTEMVV